MHLIALPVWHCHALMALERYAIFSTSNVCEKESVLHVKPVRVRELAADTSGEH